jgi:ABC-2 type transport system ATP-binding protein
MNPPAVEVRDLEKSFGQKRVLDRLDLEIQGGSIFCLLGPNGAGKTTTVHILSTLLHADGGTARICGFDVRQEPEAVRGVIGVTGQFSAVDGLLTGEENLMLMADLNHVDKAQGRDRPAELLERFGLTDASNQIVSTYSGGMRRRLDLAMTLVGNPEVIFLDEPTAGLDPRSRLTMWDIVRDLAREGTTIFLTTQNLEEADRLAGRIAVLDAGRVVAEGTPQQLKARVPGGHVVLYLRDRTEFPRALSVFSNAHVDEDALALRVPTDNSPRSVTSVLDLIDSRALAVERVNVQSADLDDVFFALTGHDRSNEDSAA